jgi:hypothetical protein
MRTGTLRHLPERGGALEQNEFILKNMSYAVLTWQIDNKPAPQHTPDDIEFMREIVQPERLTDA